MSTGKVLLGVLGGIAAGALIGVLFAPRKGSKTRRQILDKKNDYSDSIKEKINEFMDNISEKFDQIKEEVADFAEQKKSNMAEAELEHSAKK